MYYPSSVFLFPFSFFLFLFSFSLLLVPLSSLILHLRLPARPPLPPQNGLISEMEKREQAMAASLHNTDQRVRALGKAVKDKAEATEATVVHTVDLFCQRFDQKNIFGKNLSRAVMNKAKAKATATRVVHIFV